MNADLLLDVIGETSSAYLQDADTVIHAKRPTWIAWLAAAACLVIAVLIAVATFNGGTDDAKDDESSATADISAQGAAAAIDRLSFDTYDGFAAEVTDPVFEAFVSAEEAQGLDITYSVSTWVGAQDDDKPISYAMTLVKDGTEVCVFHANDQLMAESYDDWYADALEYGVRKDYIVDGVEVQKYSERDIFTAISQELLEREPDDPQRIADLERVQTDESIEQFEERVSVNGVWYYVYGKDESATDAAATALAHIAAQM